MGTTAEKLQAIINSKTAIKSAIETKGQMVGNAPLDEYAGKIAAIQTGFDGEVLTINLKTNQSDTLVPTSGIQVIIKYGAETVTRNWTGAELSEKVPPGEPVEVSVTGLIANFRSPNKQSFVTFHDNVRPLVFAYEAEKVTINVTADDGGNVASQTLTVTKVSDTSVLHTGDAGTVVLKIPLGTEYKVSVNIMSGYKTVPDQTLTASEVTRTVNLVYEKMPISQIIFDKSISDPSNISGDVNVGDVAQILAKWRRCLCKKTANGEVTIAYLRNDNSNFYDDGSAAKLDGTEGDVMVYKPEFYYKYETVSGIKFAYKFSFLNIDGTYIHSPESLIGVYKAYQAGSKLYSRSGVAPTANQTITMFETQAKARGVGYQLIDYEQHCMIAMMLYARYGNRNLQAVLGAGGARYSPATITGTTNARGNEDDVNGTTGYVNGLGIEGVFGGLYEWVSGVAINNYVWTITNPDGSTRTKTAHSADGWITTVAAESGTYFDMIPTGVGGSSATHYSDQYDQGTGSRVLARSGYSAYELGGVASTRAAYDASFAHTLVGSRLAFRGVVREALSVAAFKAIAITN